MEACLVHHSVDFVSQGLTTYRSDDQKCRYLQLPHSLQILVSHLVELLPSLQTMKPPLKILEVGNSMGNVSGSSYASEGAAAFFAVDEGLFDDEGFQKLLGLVMSVSQSGTMWVTPPRSIVHQKCTETRASGECEPWPNKAILRIVMAVIVGYIQGINLFVEQHGRDSRLWSMTVFKDCRVL